MNRKIIISINTAWNIYNFRSGLIKALVGQGYQVIAATPDDEYSKLIQEFGCRFISLPIDNNGTHPGRDIGLLARYLHLLRSERPLVYLGYTIKPNIYGSMAAHALGIPVINNISGLGTTFINRGLLTCVVRNLYKFALCRSHKIFFQNRDDQNLFIETGLVRREATDRVPGSGIDLTRYLPQPPLPLSKRAFRFLLVGRMLKDKGIADFVEASKIVRQIFPQIRFELLGFVDAANGNAISLKQIKAWEDEGVIRYLGSTDDVRPYFIDADCVVLPSYREGIPRSLLEAAAMARPIIATDAVGCRDAVDEEINGFLCKVANAADLAEKMMRMFSLSPEQRLKMGWAGRRKVEAEFNEQIVIQKYLDVINKIAGSSENGKKNQDTALTACAELPAGVDFLKQSPGASVPSQRFGSQNENDG